VVALINLHAPAVVVRAWTDVVGVLLLMPAGEDLCSNVKYLGTSGGSTSSVPLHHDGRIMPTPPPYGHHAAMVTVVVLIVSKAESRCWHSCEQGWSWWGS
jgi:hypothetical protein